MSARRGAPPGTAMFKLILNSRIADNPISTSEATCLIQTNLTCIMGGYWSVCDCNMQYLYTRPRRTSLKQLLSIGIKGLYIPSFAWRAQPSSQLHAPTPPSSKLEASECLSRFLLSLPSRLWSMLLPLHRHSSMFSTRRDLLQHRIGSRVRELRVLRSSQ